MGMKRHDAILSMPIPYTAGSLGQIQSIGYFSFVSLDLYPDEKRN